MSEQQETEIPGQGVLGDQDAGPDEELDELDSSGAPEEYQNEPEHGGEG
jgi:hypothetical protein